MLTALLRGPSPYAPQTGWPAWAVLPAGVVIFILAGFLGTLLAVLHTFLTGGFAAPELPDPQAATVHVSQGVAAWIIGLQLGLIAFTWLAAGLFNSDRSNVLSLRAPSPGWWVLPLALLPLFVGTGVWTALQVLWKPDAVSQDLKPFLQLLNSDMRWPILAAICIGAPLSEELLFRGFLFSGLAKSRLGLVGTAVLTTVLWTSLHMGYTLYGLVEVLGIGLYFSWVLIRTGSLWVTMFCHSAYNTVVAAALLYVGLPAA
jgi:membrane protease YdiL (CAAX protease family)